MNSLKKFIKIYGLTFVLLTGVWVNFSSCNGTTTDDLGNLLPDNPTDPDTDPDTPADDVPGTNDGIADDDLDFYVGISTSTLAHVRQAGSFSSKCAVSATATSSEDITCIIDVPESDLKFSGLNLVYNYPPDMCKYAVRYPYYFQNFEMGVGPTFVSSTFYVYTTKDVSNGTTATTYPSPVCDIAYDDGIVYNDPGCNSVSTTTELEFEQNEQTGNASVRCVYNREAYGGANCCFGNHLYSMRVEKTTETIDASGTSTYVTETISDSFSPANNWGGSVQRCLGGPGITDWSLFSNGSTLPAYSTDIANEGIKSVYTVQSAFDIMNTYLYGYRETLHYANYYNSVSHTHSGYYTSDSTNLPYFLSPLDDRNGSDMRSVDLSDSFTNIDLSGHDNYEFRCMDAGFETLHRIRVYVREWDTYTDFVSYITTSGTQGSPDRGNATAASTNCEGLVGPCNDFYDIDDMLDVTLPYSTGVSLSITPADVTRRRSYFPQLQYNFLD